MSVLIQRRPTMSGHTGSAAHRRGAVGQKRTGGVADPATTAPAAPVWRAVPAPQPGEEFCNAGPDVYWSAPLTDRGAA